MHYAVWNNKGGVGKSFLSFVLSTELANTTKRPVLVVDMCPQANLSEIILGGNGTGSERLEKLIKDRKTVGGYFDTRIESPHGATGKEADFLVHAKPFNSHLPENVWLIAGDPSLELQSQVINQIGGQALPVDAWKNVHNWLKNLVVACTRKLGEETATVFIDCNPSFSAYTELAMIAANRLIIPCSSDGSSARAIDNVGSLLYGIATGRDYGAANFTAKAQNFDLALPRVHLVVLNRSTQYNKKASKAFKAMFDAIKRRTNSLRDKAPQYFPEAELKFADVPDSHSVAIVCSHQGMPLYKVKPGQYVVHDTTPQVNSEPLDRYKEALEPIVAAL
jgi:chromosome partitioning protein